MEVNTFEVKGERFSQALSLPSHFPFHLSPFTPSEKYSIDHTKKKDIYIIKNNLSYPFITILFRKFPENYPKFKYQIKFFFHPLIILTFFFKKF